MAKTETALEKRFHQTCKAHGVRTIKVDPENINGFPDRIVFNVLSGEIHYIELKNNTAYERTHNQKKWASIIEECGGRYFLLDGDDDVNAYLDYHIKNPLEKVMSEKEFLKKVIDLTYQNGSNSKKIIRNIALKRLNEEDYHVNSIYL